MMMRSIQTVLVLALAVVLAGCVAAAVGAAAGAAGAIAYTDRGASSQVNASVAESAAATESVFEELGIVVTRRETEDAGEARTVEINGEQDDMEVNVQIERKDSDVTEIAVTARESAINYDKQYARNVLSRIVGRL